MSFGIFSNHIYTFLSHHDKHRPTANEIEDKLFDAFNSISTEIRDHIQKHGNLALGLQFIDFDWKQIQGNLAAISLVQNKGRVVDDVQSFGKLKIGNEFTAKVLQYDNVVEAVGGPCSLKYVKENSVTMMYPCPTHCSDIQMQRARGAKTFPRCKLLLKVCVSMKLTYFARHLKMYQIEVDHGHHKIGKVCMTIIECRS